MASGLLLDHEEAVTRLDRARRAFSKQGEPEAVARCANDLATVMLREVGDLNAARRYLDDAGRGSAAVSCDEWVRTGLLRAELESQTGDRAAATASLRALQERLHQPGTPPRVLVQTAVARIADGVADDRDGALDDLLEDARRMTPPAAALAALSGLDRVANSEHARWRSPPPSAA